MIELDWVDEVPPTRRGEGAYPHEALAAVARFYRGRYLAVKGLSATYCAQIDSGALKAYRPVTDYEATVRGYVLFVRYVGPDPDVVPPGTPLVLPPVCVAVVDELPPDDWGGAAKEMREIATALKTRPGVYARLRDWVGVDADAYPLRAMGRFEAAQRGTQAFLRYVGE